MALPEIKLIDQQGEAPSGEIIVYDQWVVFADGQQVGYLPKSPGAWLQCIVTMSEDTKAELIEAINLRVAEDIGGVSMPPDFEDEEESDE
jgi:23S rRNA U2552 (ribose-2'-O)-methylase RlmE/FtsJ